MEYIEIKIPESNYFSPERFHDALCAALHWSDDYVWIYTEKPRWRSNHGKLLALPDAYVQSIRCAAAACVCSWLSSQ